MPCPIMMYSWKNQLRYSLWNTKHPMIGWQFQITRNQIDANDNFHAVRPYPPPPQQGFAKYSIHEIEQPLFCISLHTLVFNFRLIFFSARRVPEARFELARGVPSQDVKSRVSSNSTTEGGSSSVQRPGWHRVRFDLSASSTNLGGRKDPEPVEGSWMGGADRGAIGVRFDVSTSSTHRRLNELGMRRTLSLRCVEFAERSKGRRRRGKFSNRNAHRRRGISARRSSPAGVRPRP